MAASAAISTVKKKRKKKNRNNMERQKDGLQEQQAPLKNTDRAYVQVSEDGSPVLPKEKEGEAKETKDRRPEEGSTENR